MNINNMYMYSYNNGGLVVWVIYVLYSILKRLKNKTNLFKNNITGLGNRHYIVVVFRRQPLIVFPFYFKLQAVVVIFRTTVIVTVVVYLTTVFLAIVMSSIT